MLSLVRAWFRGQSRHRSSGTKRRANRFRLALEGLENRVVLNAPGADWTLNWFDEFNGTAVDYTKWSDYLPWNSGCTGNNRYHGGDYANYMVNHDTVISGQTLTSNISVSGGQLHLRTQRVAPFRVGCKTFEYTGTMLTTGRGAIYRNWSSGYFEIRTDLPSGRGNWPAFWMTNGWPPESDIMEYWPGHRNHQGLYGMDRRWHDRNDGGGSLPSATWHTFGMEWGPGYQKYYLDDQLRYSTSGAFVPGSRNAMYLLLNSSVAQSQSGSYANANDNTLHVDYVRVYSYTPNASPRIVNPGFEAGSANWSLSGSARVVNSSQRTGNRALRMDGGAGRAEQVLTGLAPNTTYTLGGYARVSNGAAEVRLGVRNYGGADVWSGTRNTGYTRQVVLFTTGPADTQATVYCSKPTAAHAADCDDLYLVKTPTLSDIPNQTTNVDTPSDPQRFTVGDAGSAAGAWSLSATSSNPALVPNASLVFAGSGASRTIRATPAAGQSGETTVTVTVTDLFGGRASRSFILRVIPSPWSSRDIGSVGVPGSYDLDGETVVVRGSGTDIWGTSDSFHFLHRPLAGDGWIFAQVSAVDPTDPWAKAGVMIRESLAADSTHASLFVTPGHGASFQRRTKTGGGSTSDTLTGVAAPYGVYLERIGDYFYALGTADYVTWEFLGEAMIPMGETVYVGLAVTSHNNAALNASAFDYVFTSLDGGGAPRGGGAAPLAGQPGRGQPPAGAPQFGVAEAVWALEGGRSLFAAESGPFGPHRRYAHL